VLAQENPGQAAAAAKSIKADLSLVYKSMLQRIDSRGLTLLHWVLFATRPLTLGELRFAVAIKVGMTDLNPDQDLPYPYFLDLALGLLRVTVEGERRIIRFAHLTIKEYLSMHSSEYFPDGHQLLVQTCLTYLSFNAISSEAGRARYLKDGDLYPFLEYAAFEWGHHAREVAGDDPRTCDIALEWFLSERFPQLNEIRHHNWPGFWLCLLQSPLHETCYFGLATLATKLFEHKFDVNEADLVYRTPLHYAIQGGHGS
jgi:hypothetical protein